MRALVGIDFAIPLCLGLDFAQGCSVTLGSIRRNSFTKGTYGEPAVSPDVLIVTRGPITSRTESDAQGAFAVERLPPGPYQTEANAPGSGPARAVAISADASRTSLTRLGSIDCSFSREVHQHA
jgi:hypothetical protein